MYNKAIIPNVINESASLRTCVLVFIWQGSLSPMTVTKWSLALLFWSLSFYTLSQSMQRLNYKSNTYFWKWGQTSPLLFLSHIFSESPLRFKPLVFKPLELLEYILFSGGGGGRGSIPGWGTMIPYAVQYGQKIEKKKIQEQNIQICRDKVDQYLPGAEGEVRLRRVMSTELIFWMVKISWDQ